jgi:lysozyme
MGLLFPVAAVAAAAWALTKRAPVADGGDYSAERGDPAPPADDAQQFPTSLETIATTLDPSTYIGSTLNGDEAATNERAWRDMLSTSEGTRGYGDDGYNVMFGRRLFASYADHPRQYFDFQTLSGVWKKTSAAGRYQFIAPTWDALAAKLGLPDFSPASQDAACMELVRQRGALEDVRAGRFAQALAKCRPVWASLPGAGYDQPEQRLATLSAAFTASGGVITT